MFGLTSCKKENNVKPDIDQKEQLFAVQIQVNSPSGKDEKAIVIGTKKELGSAFTGERGMVLQRASKKNNVFVLDPKPVGPDVDPFKPCWDEINQYRDSHWAEWLAVANSTCKTQLHCITCPESGGGLFVMFEVKPTSIKCVKMEEALHQMVQFDFGQNVYDTPEVYEFIQKM